MDRSAYMSQPSASGGSSGGGSFVREEYAFGGPQQSMPPKRNSTSWAPYGLAGLKPSLPDEEIIEKLRKSSKYFSKIITTKEKNLSKINDKSERTSITVKSQRKEQAGLKAVKEIEELRSDKVKYAIWMETLIGDEYIGKNNDEINLMIVSNIIKICAIASPEIPFRNKEAAAEIFEIVLDVFPKVVSVDNNLFDDYYEILNIFYLYDIESIVLNWIGTSCLKSTEKLLTSIIKCAEITIPLNSSGIIIRKVGELGSLLTKILVRILSNMYIDIETLDVLFYYLVEPQKENFKKSYELCCKALSKEDASNAVIGAGRIIRESLEHDSLFTGKRTGGKLFSVIQSLEKTVPGFINDLIDHIERLAILGNNSKARYCLWRCVAESNSKVLSKISKPEDVFRYRPEWTDIEKAINVEIIGKIIENSNGTLPFIDSYIVKLFRDTHFLSKDKMLVWINSIFTKDPSKISKRIFESIGRLVNDPDEYFRHKAMIFLSSVHKSLYINGASDTYKEDVIHALSFFFNSVIHKNHSDIQRLETILVSSILSPSISEEERIDILEKLFICLNSNGISTYCLLLHNRLRLFEIVRYTLLEYKETSTVADIQTKNEFLKIYSKPNASSLYNHLPKFYYAIMKLGKFENIYDIYTSGKLSIKSVQKNLTEILEELMNLSIEKESIDQFRKLIERSAPFLMDSSFGKCMLSSLLKLAKDGKKANILKVSYLTEILRYTSKVFGFNFLFSNSLDMVADIIGYFELEPISDCGMYILKNIFTSNIEFDLIPGDREMLTNIIMKSFEKATPKAVKYGIFILLHITPEDEIQGIVDNLTKTFSNKLEKESPQCGRSFRILSGIAKFKKVTKDGHIIEVKFPEGFWKDIVEKALHVIENGPKNLSEHYKVISNSELREAIMNPSSRVLNSFEKKYSFAVKHDGVRLPLSMNQFVAFPLYFDTSTHNIMETDVIEKVANIFRNLLMSELNYWLDFSSDQESTIKYYISKTLLFLNLNSDLNANLDFSNLVAVSRCLYDTDYDVRSKLVVKIAENVYRGGAPLFSLLPMVLFSSRHNVNINIEQTFRCRVMSVFSHLITEQQKLFYKFKDKTDYYPFILSEYLISYTIICISLTPGYNNFRDMDVIKRSIVVFEAILMTYNMLSKIESKLVLISEGRTDKSSFIDADLRVSVLSELCLSLGELVFGIFGTTTQTAPDVKFSKSIFVKVKRSKKQILSMNANINELCQSAKKPTKITDVVVKSLIAIKKGSNSTKEGKPKIPTLSSSLSNKTKYAPPIIIDKSNDEDIIDSSTTKLKNKKSNSNKRFLVEISDSEDSINENGISNKETVSKLNVQKDSINNGKKNDKSTHSKTDQISPGNNVASKRITRSKVKRDGLISIADKPTVPSEISCDMSESGRTLSSSSKNKKDSTNFVKMSAEEKKGRKLSLLNSVVNKNIDEDSISIENISVIQPLESDKEHERSLFDMAERNENRKKIRKRRVLSKDNENGILKKNIKGSFDEPLASSTPCVRQITRKKKNTNIT
ncbi:Armadillo-type fold domain-containing protein [Strongyloides ratti]|uniref:Armadillo-type fold domain-containing protein n=1 Tax=Strongyloides ratti TaxID=34506 RepID=A0A090LAV9_STRRB|nr:Armadillo-type fold domain-containing protein [Strongyloides ratti]CEF65233.1 Armadillo-type fold domain-containing protein [Strongyloides ratti]